MKTSERGFTLIELMIVITIIAIIVAIGSPSYRDQVMRANRADGKIHALQIADKQERYYTDFGTYTTSLSALNMTALSENEHYSAALAAGTSGNLAIDFAITMSAEGNQVNDKCTSMVLRSDGTRTPDNCWE
jgi:type IV pilus assembly protein PilE